MSAATKLAMLAGILIVVTCNIAKAEDNPRQVFEWMKQLEGHWSLSPADQQEGGASQHPVVSPFVGTSDNAIVFSLVGARSAIHEDLLPGTAKQMATMYHCGYVECTAVEATHYCTKQNQPEFMASLDSTSSQIVFDCDMSTELCQSWDDHIHRITHELTQGGQHLKTTYSSFMNGEHNKDTIYHFDRK